MVVLDFMKATIIGFVVAMMAAITLLACPSVPPATPVDAGDDAGCAATDGTRKCPPCTCADAAPLPPAPAADAAPVPPPVVDTASAACLNLAKIGCADGLAVDCAPVLRAVLASGKFRIVVTKSSPPGLLESTTIAQARAAGAACAGSP